MRRIAGFVCAALMITVVNPLRADDDAKLREIVDRAIKAHGGADNLKKFKANVAKSKGKFYGFGDGVEYTSETSVQLPDRTRTEVESKVGGMDFKFVSVFDGKKGSTKFGDMDMEMNDDQIKEAKEQMNASNLSHLTPLADKEYKLAALGDAKVGDRAVVGIRVQRKGYRDVNLYFDKDKGLLLKSEARGKNPMSGEEFTGETLFEDYKKVDGMMVAHKITVKHDDKVFVEAEITNVKLSEKLDDKIFEKP